MAVDQLPLKYKDEYRIMSSPINVNEVLRLYVIGPPRTTTTEGKLPPWRHFFDVTRTTTTATMDASESTRSELEEDRDDHGLLSQQHNKTVPNNTKGIHVVGIDESIIGGIAVCVHSHVLKDNTTRLWTRVVAFLYTIGNIFAWSATALLQRLSQRHDSVIGTEVSIRLLIGFVTILSFSMRADTKRRHFMTHLTEAIGPSVRQRTGCVLRFTADPINGDEYLSLVQGPDCSSVDMKLVDNNDIATDASWEESTRLSNKPAKAMKGDVPILVRRMPWEYPDPGALRCDTTADLFSWGLVYGSVWEAIHRHKKRNVCQNSTWLSLAVAMVVLDFVCFPILFGSLFSLSSACHAGLSSTTAQITIVGQAVTIALIVVWNEVQTVRYSQEFHETIRQCVDGFNPTLQDRYGCSARVHVQEGLLYGSTFFIRLCCQTCNNI